MRRVILDLAVTLDGCIEGPDGEIDWCILAEDMDFGGFLAGIDTLFYGRASYDAWGTFQPDASASPTERVTWNAVHSKRKFIFSSQPRQNANATFLHSNIAGTVAVLKHQAGKTSGCTEARA